MSDWVAFEGSVEPIVWGRATYTILRVPPAAEAALAATRAHRVEGEINEHPVNLALTRAPHVEGVFLWAGQSLLDRLGVKPGQPLEIRLKAAADDRVDTSPDVEAALCTAGLLSAWERLTPGKRRSLLYRIDSARTDPTRAKRIAALIESLAP
jgi:hypothetical protein